MDDSLTLFDLIAPKEAGVKASGKLHSQRGHDDYSTTDHYLDKVREVFGGRIGCDPASSDIDNESVRAEVYYTHERSGLAAEEWPSPIFLNPPSIRRDEFLARTAIEAASGAEIIVCLNLKHLCTEYSQAMLTHVRAVHIPKGRPPFLHPTTRERTESPTDGRAFLYVGPNVERFLCVFGKDTGWTFAVTPAPVVKRKNIKAEIV